MGHNFFMTNFPYIRSIIRKLKIKVVWDWDRKSSGV